MTQNSKSLRTIFMITEKSVLMKKIMSSLMMLSSRCVNLWESLRTQKVMLEVHLTRMSLKTGLILTLLLYCPWRFLPRRVEFRTLDHWWASSRLNILISAEGALGSSPLRLRTMFWTSTNSISSKRAPIRVTRRALVPGKLSHLDLWTSMENLPPMPFLQANSSTRPRFISLT